MLETPSNQPAAHQSRLQQTLTVLGAATGIAAFLWTTAWQWNKAATSSVEIGLVLKVDPVHVIADMTVENKGDTRQKIDYAALLFTPHDQSFVFSARQLANCAGDSARFDGSGAMTTVLTLPHSERVLSCNGSLIDPVPFLYEEQRDVGNEKIGCEASVDLASLEPGKQYDVRFVVFQDSTFRSTEALFFTPNPTATGPPSHSHDN